MKKSIQTIFIAAATFIIALLFLQPTYSMPIAYAIAGVALLQVIIGFAIKNLAFMRLSASTFVGIVFAFSGIAKQIDPWGSAYKFNDYFHAFGIPSNDTISLILSIVMSAAELSVGIALIFNTKVKLASWGAVLFMLIFTPITLYLALYNPVEDCGCFGDAVKLSNWGTFYKNIFISAFVVLLFLQRVKFEALISTKIDAFLATFFVLISLLFGYYSVTHLPIIDFRPYKIGTYIPDAMKIPEGKEPDKYANLYKIKNLKNNEIRDITSDDYLADSTYWNDKVWQIIETGKDPVLVKKGYTPPIHDLTIVTLDSLSFTGMAAGSNIIDTILKLDRPVFWFVAYNLEKSCKEALVEANKIASYCKQKNYEFMCLTSTQLSTIEKVKSELQLDYQFYNADETTLKTIIRSNPGLVLLKKGKVLDMWHYNDLPENEDIEKSLK